MDVGNRRWLKHHGTPHKPLPPADACIDPARSPLGSFITRLKALAPGRAAAPRQGTRQAIQYSSGKALDDPPHLLQYILVPQAGSWCLTVVAPGPRGIAAYGAALGGPPATWRRGWPALQVTASPASAANADNVISSCLVQQVQDPLQQSARVPVALIRARQAATCRALAGR